MGISGLLPLLKSIHKPCTLKKFAGQTIGVDAYGWLHRGTVACAMELALDKPTTKVVDFAMNRVRMLVHFGITPYLVFDGDYLPSKAGTEKERAAKRKESRRLGLELLKVGKTSQAHLELQKAVDVTPEMARQLIEELKHHNIQYVVAPYEADSQLVYLERKGIINGILSEDSDLLVFGAKCLLTKLDKYGECVEINRNLFTACREISLVGWSDADFRRMAILSGCDYLPGIGKMGLKTAYRMLRKHKTVERLVRAAQFDGQYKVPAGYLDAFYQAETTFLYQWVFCPRSKRLVNLTTPEAGVDVAQMSYIGIEVPSDIAIGVSNGNLHPHSKQPIIVQPKDRSHSRPIRPARIVSTPAQTPDLKQAKPIDSFFKPRRTPLAELDPNIFTPSPSQQALLEQQQQSQSWTAALAPPSLSQYRSSLPRTAPQPARRAISDSTQRRSVPNPSKRQRLCSDTPIMTPRLDNGGTERSRFFTASMTEPSPSLRPAKSRKTKDDFELFSDDSLHEAMIQAAEVEEVTTRKTKKIAIFKDDSQSSFKTESQSSTLSRSATDQSQLSFGTLTPATSCGSLPPEDQEDSVFSAALSAQVTELRSRFSYTSGEKAQRSGPESSGSKSPVAVQSADYHTSLITSTTSQATAQGEQSASLKADSSKVTQPEEDCNELEDSAWAAMEAEVVVAASDTEGVEQSPVKYAMPKRLQLTGSEDCLVPDSESESDCSPQKPTLDFGRFAYSG